jgi:hypothetical protein
MQTTRKQVSSYDGGVSGKLACLRTHHDKDAHMTACEPEISDSSHEATRPGLKSSRLWERLLYTGCCSTWHEVYHCRLLDQYMWFSSLDKLFGRPLRHEEVEIAPLVCLVHASLIQTTITS